LKKSHCTRMLSAKRFRWLLKAAAVAILRRALGFSLG
jgi:hypothetical protein